MRAWLLRCGVRPGGKRASRWSSCGGYVERGVRRVLACGFDLDVRCTDPFERPFNSFKSKMRAVAVAAQMAKIYMPETLRNNLFDHLASRLVRQMPVSAQNTLLYAPWAPRVFLEESHVVICFEHEHMSGFDSLDDQARCVSEVGDKADGACGRVDEKSDRVLRVVRHRKTLDCDVADRERCAGCEQPAVKVGADLMIKRVFGEPVAIDRQGKFPAQDGQTLGVVIVFMSEQYAIQSFG